MSDEEDGETPMSGEEMMEELALKISQVKSMREQLGGIYQDLNMLKIKIDKFCQKQ